jgi:hypothetical protein
MQIRSRRIGSTAATLAASAAALISAGPAGAADGPARSSKEHFPIVELRQYTLHQGQRDTLIDLFEREFIESQEELGLRVIGTFRDLDRPDRFVWLRGFRDMDARVQGLTAFYGGPVWQAHRNEANATMVDSDNVLLLHAPAPAAEFQLNGNRPRKGASAAGGLFVATIYYLKVPPGEALPAFERQVKPGLERAGITVSAWFIPEPLPNNFPRLPVRAGEKVLVWFAGFRDVADFEAHASAIVASERPIKLWFARRPEVLKLAPTGRSLIRGGVGRSGE